MAKVAALQRQDLAEIQAFISGEIAERDQLPPVPEAFDYLGWYLFENPSNPEGFAGWGIRDDAGNLAGLHLCSLQKLAVPGGTLPLCMSNGYYVNKAHRGPLSAVLFQRFIEMGKTCVLGGTTTNAMSGRVWKAVKHSRLCPGGDREVLIPVRAGGLLSEAARRRGWPGGLCRSIAALPMPVRWLWASRRPGKLRRLTSADELISALGTIREAQQDYWVRDASWLHWRLFDSRLQKRTSVWHYQEGSRSIVAATHHSKRGDARIPVTTVTKLWLDRDGGELLRPLLAGLATELRPRPDLIATRFSCAETFRSHLGKWALLRQLPDPAGWQADPSGLLKGEDLPLVPGDGDSCIAF